MEYLQGPLIWLSVILFMEDLLSAYPLASEFFKENRPPTIMGFVEWANNWEVITSFVHILDHHLLCKQFQANKKENVRVPSYNDVDIKYFNTVHDPLFEYCNSLKISMSSFENDAFDLIRRNVFAYIEKLVVLCQSPLLSSPEGNFSVYYFCRHVCCVKKRCEVNLHDVDLNKKDLGIMGFWSLYPSAFDLLNNNKGSYIASFSRFQQDKQIFMNLIYILDSILFWQYPIGHTPNQKVYNNIGIKCFNMIYEQLCKFSETWNISLNALECQSGLVRNCVVACINELIAMS